MVLYANLYLSNIFSFDIVSILNLNDFKSCKKLMKIFIKVATEDLLKTCIFSIKFLKKYGIQFIYYYLNLPSKKGEEVLRLN
jgi:hypothetical protein